MTRKNNTLLHTSDDLSLVLFNPSKLVFLKDTKTVEDALNQIKSAALGDLPIGSLTVKGIVQLTNTIKDNEELALTPKALYGYTASLTAKGGVKLTNTINDKNNITEATTPKGVYDFVTKVMNEVVGENIQIFTNLLVGSPIPWPSAIVPPGALAFNGQTFDPIKYPILLKLYPGNRLIDLRAMVIKGWDNNRGIDAGRELLLFQDDAIRNITGTIVAWDRGSKYWDENNTGAFYRWHQYNSNVKNGKLDNWSYLANFDASRVVPTASENRVKNIAFQYITLAG